MKSLLFFSFLIISAFCIIDDSFLSVPTPSIENHENLGAASSLDILKLAGNFCQGSGLNYQCGPGNCEIWTTGNTVAGIPGSNKGLITCNADGLFCFGGCFSPCMDKSPDTKITHFSYGVPSPKRILPEVIITHHVDNYENNQQTGSYSFSQTVGNSYSWSWSNTMTTSLSLSISAGIPEICDLKEDFSVSISNTYSQSQSKTTTKTWSTTANFVVPPKQTLAVDYIVNKVEYVVPFTMTVEFGGTFAYWCNKQANGHYFWMVDVAAIIGTQVNCQQHICNFSGVFTGVQGISDNLKYRACKLGVNC